ncbi:hypothetical protein ACFS7Z_24230 [Pontibacter toksunensis]|uniref:Cytochrome c7-like domain-containing protein n=1 Tax=Pontibacter toksunensis TaxID=1332631 RepID=A0ABW6C0H8_9BACT
MNYKEQLESTQWKNKRNAILERDQYRCQECYNKSLIERSRISFHGAGTAQNKVVYIVFDIETGRSYRCKTGYGNAFISELLKISEHYSLLSLTTGDDVFCRLIATVVLPVRLSYPKDITDETALRVEKQKTQELYLKSLTPKELKEIRWIDTKSLHIHHRYYQVGKLAWEYPDLALTTLCWECHEKLHAETEIDVLTEQGEIIGHRKVCVRCHGAGWFPEYNHVKEGVCFRCNGRRFEDSSYQHFYQVVSS